MDEYLLVIVRGLWALFIETKPLSQQQKYISNFSRSKLTIVFNRVKSRIPSLDDARRRRWGLRRRARKKFAFRTQPAIGSERRGAG
jgi:hypothetical protein